MNAHDNYPDNFGQALATALQRVTDDDRWFDSREVDAVRDELLPMLPPVDMVLYCPACATQHIDAPEVLPMAYAIGVAHFSEGYKHWNNPLHRSHLCGMCGYIWRPADVATNGVAAIKTRGRNDSPAVNVDVRQHTSATIAHQMAMRKLVEESGRNIDPDLIGAQMQALAHESAASATPRRKPEPSKNRPFDCLNVHKGPRYDDPPVSEPRSSGYRCMCFECALSRGEA